MRKLYPKTVSTLGAVVLVAAGATLIRSDDASGTDEAAIQGQIRQTAAALCGGFLEGGSASRVVAEGEIDAEIAALVRVLGALGVEGTAEIDTAEWTGVLQDILPQERDNTRQCNIHVFEILMDRIYPPSPSAPPGTASPATPTVIGDDIVTGDCNIVVDINTGEIGPNINCQ